MDDFSKLSDEELEALAAGESLPTPISASTTDSSIPDMSKLTDEQLIQMMETQPGTADDPLQFTKLESAGQGLIDIGSFGLSDEAIGAYHATKKLLGGDSGLQGKNWTEAYQAARDLERKKQDVAYEQNPWSYGAGGVGGAVAPILATAGAGMVGAGAKVGTNIATKAAPSTLKTMASALVPGAVMGAGASTTEFAGAEDKLAATEDVAKDATSAALMNAAGAGIMSKALPAIGRGITGLDAYKKLALAYAAAKETGESSVTMGKKAAIAAKERMKEAAKELPDDYEALKNQVRDIYEDLYKDAKYRKKVKVPPPPPPAPPAPLAPVTPLPENVIPINSSIKLPVEPPPSIVGEMVPTQIAPIKPARAKYVPADSINIEKPLGKLLDSLSDNRLHADDAEFLRQTLRNRGVMSESGEINNKIPTHVFRDLMDDLAASTYVDKKTGVVIQGNQKRLASFLAETMPEFKQQLNQVFNPKGMEKLAEANLKRSAQAEIESLTKLNSAEDPQIKAAEFLKELAIGNKDELQLVPELKSEALIKSMKKINPEMGSKWETEMLKQAQKESLAQGGNVGTGNLSRKLGFIEKTAGFVGSKAGQLSHATNKVGKNIASSAVVEKVADVSKGLYKMSPETMKQFANKVGEKVPEFGDKLSTAASGKKGSAASIFALSQMPEFRNLARQLMPTKEEEGK